MDAVYFPFVRGVKVQLGKQDGYTMITGLGASLVSGWNFRLEELQRKLMARHEFFAY
jgi:hypothetical protein